MHDPLDLGPFPDLRITVRGVRMEHHLSAESCAFVAIIFLDGARLGEVGNAGQGGSHFYRVTWTLQQQLIRAAHEWAASANLTDRHPLDYAVDEALNRQSISATARSYRSAGHPYVAVLYETLQLSVGPLHFPTLTIPLADRSQLEPALTHHRATAYRFFPTNNPPDHAPSR